MRGNYGDKNQFVHDRPGMKKITFAAVSIASSGQWMRLLSSIPAPAMRPARLPGEYGATVQSFIWNDNFSNARNISLELASGNWILFLDADEELSRESAPVLRRIAEDETVDGYFIKIINYIGNEGWTDFAPDLVFRLSGTGLITDSAAQSTSRLST